MNAIKISAIFLVAALSGCGGYGITKPVDINILGLLPIVGCVLCPNDGSPTYSYDKSRLRRGVVTERLNRTRSVYPVVPAYR